MKIIYLHQYFNTPTMSGGTRSFEMAKQFVEAGHEVEMITSFREECRVAKHWFQTTESGINVHWLPVIYSNSMGFWARIKAFFHFAWASTIKAAELKGDIVFATSTPLTIAIPAVLSARLSGLPMVFEVRDLWPEMPIAMGLVKNPIFKFAARKLELWAYFNSAAIVALSPGMKKGIEKTGYPSTKIAVIPNSCDNNLFKTDAISLRHFRRSRAWLGDRPLLVYVGTFGQVNGLEYLVKLAQELLVINSNIRILIVGDGKERNRILKLARDSGVLDVNFFIEGRVPKNEVPIILSSADMACCVFSDVHEMQANSANKFFDALAAGKPVLINFGGWMEDLLVRHGCGLAMWRRPVSEVAVLINDKINDNQWMKLAGMRSRSLAEKYFDRDILAAQLLSTLELARKGAKDGFDVLSPVEYQDQSLR